MTSLHSSQKRTRMHSQGEFLEQKDFFGPLATLELTFGTYLLELTFGLTFSNKDSFNSIQKKKSDHVSGKYGYARPGSKSKSMDRGSADKASVLADLHLGIHSFSFNL